MGSACRCCFYDAVTRYTNFILLASFHFYRADKVFKDLFSSHTQVPLVDAAGHVWDCAVQIETRNDLRLQYTLRVSCRAHIGDHDIVPLL
jgi:uncharacterized membrane protein YbaN (DUF454 family)